MVRKCSKTFFSYISLKRDNIDTLYSWNTVACYQLHNVPKFRYRAYAPKIEIDPSPAFHKITQA